MDIPVICRTCGTRDLLTSQHAAALADPDNVVVCGSCDSEDLDLDDGIEVQAVQSQYEYDFKLGVEDAKTGRPRDPQGGPGYTAGYDSVQDKGSVRDPIYGSQGGQVEPNCAKGDHAQCSLSMLCACPCHRGLLEEPGRDGWGRPVPKQASLPHQTQCSVEGCHIPAKANGKCGYHNGDGSPRIPGLHGTAGTKLAAKPNPRVAGAGAYVTDASNSGIRKEVPQGTVATPAQGYTTWTGQTVYDWSVQGIDGAGWQLGGTWTEQTTGRRAYLDPEMNTLGDVQGVAEALRCSSCFHVWNHEAIHPGDEIPPCPRCGSKATSAAGPQVTASAERAPLTHLTLTGAYAGHPVCDEPKRPGDKGIHAAYAPESAFTDPQSFTPPICPACIKVWKEDDEAAAPESGQMEMFSAKRAAKASKTAAESATCANCGKPIHRVENPGGPEGPWVHEDGMPDCDEDRTSKATPRTASLTSVVAKGKKVAEIVDGILATNPSMSVGDAYVLATKTVTRFPKVVG